jgi:hypothetical protein
VIGKVAICCRCDVAGEFARLKRAILSSFRSRRAEKAFQLETSVGSFRPVPDWTELQCRGEPSKTLVFPRILAGKLPRSDSSFPRELALEVFLTAQLSSGEENQALGRMRPVKLILFW